MLPDEILADVRARFPDLEVVSTHDTHFVYSAPSRALPLDRRQPFLTIVTNDAHDAASALGNGRFRVNFGLSRASYRARFGPEPAWSRDGAPVATGHDFTATDVLLPHPVYAPLSWVSIVSPSRASWARLAPLVDEAHALHAERHARAGADEEARTP